MAKKSRRLPGGKVRKPLAQHPRPLAPAPAGQVETEEDDAPLDETAEQPVVVRPSTPVAAPVRPSAQVLSPAPAAEARRVGVGARRTTAAGVPRRSTTLMELAAANYGHIRSDLARIGILAVIMLAIIVALSFVLPPLVK